MPLWVFSFCLPPHFGFFFFNYYYFLIVRKVYLNCESLHPCAGKRHCFLFRCFTALAQWKGKDVYNIVTSCSLWDEYIFSSNHHTSLLCYHASQNIFTFKIWNKFLSLWFVSILFFSTFFTYGIL